VERIQESCPRLSDQDLSRTVEIYEKLEQSSTGSVIVDKYLFRGAAEALSEGPSPLPHVIVTEETAGFAIMSL
jgi:hypothetical protein